MTTAVPTLSQSPSVTLPLLVGWYWRGGTLSGSGQGETKLWKHQLGFSGVLMSFPVISVRGKLRVRHPGTESSFQEHPWQLTKRSELYNLLERD